MSNVTPDLLEEHIDYDWTRRAYGLGSPAGIRVMVYDMHRAGGFGMHADDDLHQLTWAVDSGLAAYVGDQHWLLPPHRGVWLPAGTPHDVAPLEPGRLVCVYLNAELTEVTRDGPSAVEIDGLLRGLIEHLLGPLDEDEGIRAQTVLLDALVRRWHEPPTLPLPRDLRARRVARRFLEQPDLGLTIAEVAKSVGVSERTLRRRFLAETNLTIQQWLVACRVHSSMGPLLRGESVADVSASVGYASPSAYIAAFKARMGTTPARFRQESDADADGLVLTSDI